MSINPHNRIPNTPLIYEPPKDGALCKNLLLINDSVNDNKVFTTSVNSDTFPITYSYTSDRSELLTVLQSTFTTIDRIGIVSQGGNTRFLNMKSFFDNAQFLIYVIKEFGVKNIDFLACSSLNKPEWVNFYTMLNTETGVVVGASNDETGNIKYGGDWVMESTSQDIEFVYFTEGITYYQYLLDSVAINGLTYNLFPVTLVATVTGYDTVPPTNLVIPSTVFYPIDGITYNVTIIQGGSFTGLTEVTSVTIGNNVTTIGNGVFDSCTNLASVTIGNSVTTIGNSVFYGCTSLTSITIPDSVTIIGTSAFLDCTDLASLTIGNSLTSIGAFAFSDCTSLTSITIPGSVTTIGNQAFQNCTILATYKFIGNPPTSLGTNVFNGGPPTVIGYYNANNYTLWQPYTPPNTFGGLNMYGMFFGIVMRDMFTFHIHYN